MWEAYLTPRLLTYRLRPMKRHYGLLNFQPNLVSRQFGLIQLKPKSLYEKKGHMCLHNMFSTKEGFELKTKRYIGVTYLTPISFRPPFIVPKNFLIGGQNNTPMRSSACPISTNNLLKNFLLFMSISKKVRLPTSRRFKRSKITSKTAYMTDDLS